MTHLAAWLAWGLLILGIFTCWRSWRISVALAFAAAATLVAGEWLA